MTVHVKIENLNKFSIISFKDLKNIDANSALRIKAEINGLIDPGTKNLVVDLEGIHFIDSSGFGTLISILKTIKGRGGRLILCHVAVEVQELMDLMQLANVFEIKESLRETETIFS